MSDLSPGDAKLVEILRQLALAPRMLLLDEPAAAMTVNQIEILSGIIRGIAARGIGVLVIDHNLSFVLEFAGQDLTSVPQNDIAKLGVGYVPQQGNVFPELSVGENLQVSCRGSLSEARAITNEVVAQFPRLKERIKQAAATLSGGERQMLAIACARVSSPSLLMLDEPTTGLAPLIVRERIADIQRLRDRGAGILWIIEEHPRICLPAVDKVHFMSDGTLGPAMAASALLEEGALEELFFGVSH